MKHEKAEELRQTLKRVDGHIETVLSSDTTPEAKIEELAHAVNHTRLVLEGVIAALDEGAPAKVDAQAVCELIEFGEEGETVSVEECAGLEEGLDVFFTRLKISIPRDLYSRPFCINDLCLAPKGEQHAYINLTWNQDAMPLNRPGEYYVESCFEGDEWIESEQRSQPTLERGLAEAFRISRLIMGKGEPVDFRLLDGETEICLFRVLEGL